MALKLQWKNVPSNKMGHEKKNKQHKKRNRKRFKRGFSKPIQLSAKRLEEKQNKKPKQNKIMCTSFFSLNSMISLRVLGYSSIRPQITCKMHSKRFFLFSEQFQMFVENFPYDFLMNARKTRKRAYFTNTHRK